MNERKTGNKDGGATQARSLFVEVPRGWSRIMENGCILYISPNNSKLRSLDHVIEYLKAEGTCKCGLECPLYVHKVFNFDARVPSRILKKDSSTSASACKHCYIEISKNLSEKLVRQVEQSANYPPLSSKPSDESEKKRGPGRPRKYPESKGRNRSHGISNAHVKTLSPPVANQGQAQQSATVVQRYHGLIVSVAASTTQRTNIFNKPTFATTVSSGPGGKATPVSTRNVHGVQLAAQAPTTTKVTLPPISVLALPVTECNLSPPAISVLPSSVFKQGSTTSPKLITTLTGSKLVLSPEMVRSALMHNPSAKVLSISTNAVKSVVSSVVTPNKVVGTSASVGYNATTSITTVGQPKRITKPRARTSASKTNRLSVTKTAPKVLTSVVRPVMKPAVGIYPSNRTTGAATSTTTTSTVTSSTNATPKTSTVTTARVLITTLGQAGGLVHGGAVFPGQVSVGSSLTSSVPTKTVFLYAVPLPVSSTSGSVNTISSSAGAIGGLSVSRPVTVVGTQSSAKLGIPSTTSIVSSGASKVNVIGIPASYTTKTSGSVTSAAKTKEESQIFLPHQTVLGIGPVLTQVSKQTKKVHIKQEPHSPTEGVERSSMKSPGKTGTVKVESKSDADTPVMSGKFSPQVSKSHAKTSISPRSKPSSQPITVHSNLTTGQVPVVTPQGLVLGMTQPGAGKPLLTSQVEGGYALVNPQLQLRVASNAMAALASGAHINTPLGVASNTPGIVNPYFLSFVAPVSGSATQSGTAPTTSGVTTMATLCTQPNTVSGVSSAAIAAAYENFVPIAPANTTQRVPQALAYLSNVYNPFSHGVAPRMNVLQYPYMMQPGGPYSVNITGSGNVNVLGSTGQKFPISAYIPSFPNSSASVVSTVIAKTSPQSTSTVVCSSEQTKLSTSSATVMSTAKSSSPKKDKIQCSSSKTDSINESVTSSPHTVLIKQELPSPPSTYSNVNNVSHSQDNGKSEFKSPVDKSSPMKRGTGKSVIWNPALDCCDVVDNKELESKSGEFSGSSDIPERLVNVSFKNTASNISTQSSGSISFASTFSSFQPIMSVNKNSESRTHTSVNDSACYVPLICTPTTVTSSPMSDFVSLAAMKESIDDNYCERLRKVIGDADELTGGDNESIGSDSLHSSRADSRCSDNSETSTASETAEYLLDCSYEPTVKKIRHSYSPKRENKKPPVSPDREKTHTDKSKERRTKSLKRNAQDFDCEESCDNDVRSSKRLSQAALSNASVILANGDMPTTTQATSSIFSSISLQSCVLPTVRRHFVTGDIVWAQARGLPSWPGKIVDERDVGKEKPAEGKRWVKWFGDHTLSQVEVERLKTLTDGLRSLDDKGKKKKCRGKKTRVSLEQAISEALEEVEKREKLRVKQGTKATTKKRKMK